MAVETDAEIGRIVEAVRREGRVDLEAVEQAVRAAVLGAGAKVLEGLLQGVGVGRRDEAVRCGRCAAVMESHGVRAKDVQTLVGGVRFERSLYVCPRCGQTRYPGDEALDIVQTSRSPGVRRQVARLGAKEPFAEVATDLRELAQLEVCRKEAERLAEAEGRRMGDWMEQEGQTLRLQEPPPPQTPPTLDTLYVELDGTGIPMVPREVEDRPGRQPDGTARTREAKVGCVFPQTGFEEQGRPVRDPAATSFTAAIEPCDAFGKRLYAEAVRRGLFHARRVVVLGDGAEWVKGLAQYHFPHALFILDYYHAAEHLADLARALFERHPQRLAFYRDRWADALWEGDIESLLDQAAAFLPQDPSTHPEARGHLHYFEKNKDHMRYGLYRQQGLFIGSGVVEAACKHLVAARLKQSGMEWTVEGANAILALRTVLLSHRFEEYYEQRAAA